MANIHSSISFALVNIPVVINPVINNNDTAFNQLHKKCMHRIKYVKYCPICKKDIKETDIIKGYEYEKDKYIVFNKEELNKLKPVNEKEIAVIGFIKLNEIDPTYFEKSYTLLADTSLKAYILFYEALKKTKMVALCTTVIGTKFYYVILRLNQDAIIMTTLYFYEEINVLEEEMNKKINTKELELATKLILSMKTKFKPDTYHDLYQDTISKAIDDKLNGKTIKGSKKTNRRQIKDLMSALEKSLKK